MKTIKGDLIKLAKEGKFDVIAHGCNCFCTMGAGIAKTIKENFPQAYQADLETMKGDENKLGTCSYATITSPKLTIVNAYTQYTYGRLFRVHYNAIRQCMKLIKMNFSGSRIGLPKIGAGLAGGHWHIIQAIIEDELKYMDVTIVEFEQ